MFNDFSTIKTSTLYFPKLRVVRAKKYKKLNCFLKRSENNIFHHNNYFSNEKTKTNTNTINNYIFNSYQINKENYPKKSSQTLINNIKTPRNSYRIDNYTNKKSYDTNRNIRKINGIFMDFINKKKNNSKLKNQGITTCDSFFSKKKTKLNNRYLTLGKNENNMDNLSTFNNNTFRDYFINSYDKMYKYKFSLNKKLPLKILSDKYAYIYMSDKSELIKHWRRINYNPLNV